MRVLIVGSLCDDKWIGSLIRSLYKVTDIQVDFFHIITSGMQLSEASKLCDNVFFAKRHLPSFFYKVPILSHILSLIDVPVSLKRFFKERTRIHCSYDVVNIHYPQNKVLCCWRGFDAISSTTIVTPWGSEVLRISRLSQRLMNYYMRHYGYMMSSDNPRFKSQLQRILNIPESRFLSCDFGSEMIDELCNSTITKQEAKKRFGIDSQYTIVCGYNGSISQNHMKIIQAIASVRDRLPKELIIVLPMTYNTTATYINKVQELLVKNHLDNVILKSYLSNSDMVCLRKCADMFIHAQETDANSVSLAEHLLCDNVVVNAKWLRYENREVFGVPYYLFDSFNDLPEVIVAAYNGGPIVPEKLKKAISEEGWSIVINKWIELFNKVSS